MNIQNNENKLLFISMFLTHWCILKLQKSNKKKE